VLATTILTLTKPDLRRIEMASPKLCSVPDCGKPYLATGLCSKHWQRRKKYGDPLAVSPDLKRWSYTELCILKNGFGSRPTQELQERLPRFSLGAIAGKACELRLSKAAEAVSASRKEAGIKRRGRPAKNKGKWLNKECEVCSASFSVPIYRAERKRFCGLDCQRQSMRNVTGAGHPLFRRQPRTCEWCKSSFLAIPAKIKAGEGRFCSRNCIGGYVSFQQQGRRSSIELMVEEELVSRDVQFVAQKQMAHFLCDFYVAAHRLVIECDGDYWHAMPNVVLRDARKDKWLLSHGQRIVRLTEKEIRLDCRAAVDRALA
jgi:very-short-patch-repair endonuclease